MSLFLPEVWHSVGQKRTVLTVLDTEVPIYEV